MLTATTQMKRETRNGEYLNIVNCFQNAQLLCYQRSQSMPWADGEEGLGGLQETLGRTARGVKASKCDVK